ncbi:5-enolpyruvylshikimate-3-phosphate synthase [Idiomarina xiamenensis 10-D-4]|uniref:3-phosphoshikimate 1-carboxyvinyltransferase n=1 Tax=Idiomarina xiamenensis 10-D-4 TaxID=740709 RepID=K2KJP8_9GAMM|nr:5-enolpyruvylshikimate-3-phosphate synthase [Idiomarina xiamenensis 10-D-4]
MLQNLLQSDDTEHMQQALQRLGVGIQRRGDNAWLVQGNGGQWQALSTALYLGNAGTAMRPLTAVLAATAREAYCLTGDARMCERPLGDLVDALRQGGAQIDYQHNIGYPPLSIKPGLRGGIIRVDGSTSSQYISALLMALPLLKDDSELHLIGTVVSRPYINLTLAMLRDFGIAIQALDDNRFAIAGGQRYQLQQASNHYWVEGDASAASYWIAAGVLGHGPLRIDGVGRHSIQGDINFADVVARMGGQVTLQAQHIEVAGGQLHGIDVDLNTIPDAAMTIAVLALFAKGDTRIRGVANWRVKETDRIDAMANELRKVGASVTIYDDGLAISPPQHWQHADIKTYNDHRMAMCFSLLAFAPSGVTICDPACCSKTYPRYFTEFARLCPAPS